MKTQSMKDLILQMPFAKVIELHNPVIPVYKCMYYFPQPAVNLYLTDNTRGGETKPLTSTFPVVFIYLKFPAENAGNGTLRPWS